MNNKRFVIAYGNRDREDDGAGWHIGRSRFADHSALHPAYFY